MFDDLKRELDRIAAEPPHWTETRILGWGKNALVNELERVSQPPNWWQRRDSPAVAAIQTLFRRYERANDDEDQTEAEKKARRQRAAAGRGAGRENVEAEQDNEKKCIVDWEVEEAIEALLPNATESISDWFARIAKDIDSNGHRKTLWDGLRAYASRFRGDAKAKTLLDAKLVRVFLKNALSN